MDPFNDYLQIGLLQSGLHGATLENTLEIASGPECRCNITVSSYYFNSIATARATNYSLVLVQVVGLKL